MEETCEVEEDQHIDPWTVTGGADGKIDYNKLLEQVSALSASFSLFIMQLTYYIFN